MWHLKSTSSNFLTCKVSYKKKKTLNMGPKIPYLVTFRFQFNKNYSKIFNQPPGICENIKFYPKQKKIFLIPKMLYLGLWAGMLKNYSHISNKRAPIYLMTKIRAKIRILYLGALGSNLEKTLSYLKINTLQFALLQSLAQRITIL